jgi:GAF domain-containing protein
MPIDQALLTNSINTLTDRDPRGDLEGTLQQAVAAVKQLFAADAAGVMLVDADGALRSTSASDQRAEAVEDSQEIYAAGPCRAAFISRRPAAMYDATLELRWGQIALAFVELQIRSGLSVPVELGGGPIGTLDIYAAAPRGWDQTDASALQAYARGVASMLGRADEAKLTGRLAARLQIALDSRGLIEQGKGTLMEPERQEGQDAFTSLSLWAAAKSSGRKVAEVAREVVASLPLPYGRAKPAGDRAADKARSATSADPSGGSGLLR